MLPLKQLRAVSSTTMITEAFITFGIYILLLAMMTCLWFLNCSWFKIVLEDEMTELRKTQESTELKVLFNQTCAKVGSSSCCLHLNSALNPFIKMPAQCSKVKRHMICQTAENAMLI